MSEASQKGAAKPQLDEAVLAVYENARKSAQIAVVQALEAANPGIAEQAAAKQNADAKPLAGAAQASKAYEAAERKQRSLATQLSECHKKQKKLEEQLTEASMEAHRAKEAMHKAVVACSGGSPPCDPLVDLEDMAPPEPADTEGSAMWAQLQTLSEAVKKYNELRGEYKKKSATNTNSQKAEAVERRDDQPESQPATKKAKAQDEQGEAEKKAEDEDMGTLSTEALLQQFSQQAKDASAANSRSCEGQPTG